MEISKELKNKYNKQYLDEDTEWRMIGAKGKAEASRRFEGFAARCHCWFR